MKEYFRKIYNKIVLQLYIAGKQQYLGHWQATMEKRVSVGTNSRFTIESEIINLANDASKIKIGNNCNISGLLLVYNYEGLISMGDNCSLSPNSRIISSKSIVIGNRVLIAHNVNIIDNISHPIDAALRHQDFLTSYTIGMQDYDRKSAAIIIEDDVWIGLNSTIMRGVTIGKGAIIGANSVVTKSVKPWTVNIGNPLRCIRELNPVEVK